jgi:hypothetical protein
MKTKFLWIEDGATADLRRLLAPILVDGLYDPIIALDVSEGIRQLRVHEFSAVIVDIRIPPGDHPAWINLYNQLGKNKARARLGLKLLTSLFKPQDDDIEIADMPTWVTPEKFGVLTVESQNEVESSLRDLNITVYRQKTAETPKTILEELLRDIVREQYNA